MFEKISAALLLFGTVIKSGLIIGFNQRQLPNYLFLNVMNDLSAEEEEKRH